MRRAILLIFLLLAASLLAADPFGFFDALARESHSVPAVTKTAEPQQREIAGKYGRLPLSFEANRGQFDARVRFKARGLNYDLFLTASEAVFAMRSDKPEGLASEGSVLRMKLVGSNRQARVVGLDEAPGKIHYFIGNDQSKWRRNVPAYSQVRYLNAYPGIDLVYHGNQQELEYDFVIAPGASPRRIRMAFEGSNKIVIDGKGNLILSTPAGEVRQNKPIAYQQINGERREVEVSYELRGNKVAFQTGQYDKSHPLTIDPVLSYSTHIGGSDTEEGLGIAVDSQGNAYLTGTTTSTDFPVASAFQPVKGSFDDAFVVKLNPMGTALVYGTYLGGNGTDDGNAIAVDAQGSAYVVGFTGSGSFPTTLGVVQNSKDGFADAFISKLNPDGSLSYSSFLGGDNNESALGVAVDASSRAYVVGRTDSNRFRSFFFGTPRNGSPAYKSLNNGGDWAPASAGLTPSTVNSLTLDPVNSNTIYAATNFGVFKSFNGGASWAISGGTPPLSAPSFVNLVKIDPSNSATIYAAASNGVYKSTNGGVSWTLKSSGFFSSQTGALAIDPTTPATIYAGNQTSIWKSFNGGDTWAQLNVPGGTSRVNEIVIDPTNTNIIYIATNRGLHKSNNGGLSWSGLSVANSFQVTFLSIAIDPLNSLTLYAGSGFGADSIYKTTDGGATWTSSSTGLTFPIGGLTVTAFINQIAIDPITPSTIYLATAQAGIFKSTDAGATWNPSNTNLPNTNVLDVVIDKINPAIVYVGTTIGTDVFALRLNSTGSAFEYFSNFGGHENDEARAIAVDTDNTAYVVGATSSKNFPSINAFQPLSGEFGDAFVTKINAAGTGFGYSTYLGGNLSDSARGVAVRNGSAYVVGQTTSANFPVVNSLKPAPTNFDSDAFVTKFSPSGASLDFSTYLGGTFGEQGFGIALDPAGSVYVVGNTASSDFPIAAAPQPSPGGAQDAFVTKLIPSGAAIAYSTYLGGNFTEFGNGIAVDAAGNAFIGGTTFSSNFPTASPFQSTLKGTSDAFVSKLGPTVSGTTVHFSQLQYSADEATPSVQIDVRRSGDLSGTSTVEFETVNGTASDRSDFTATFGTLTFAPGDAVESFSVLLTDDALVEGTESLRLKLSNPVGATLVSSTSDPLPHDVLMEIRDNDSNPSAPNPIENSTFFVRQHYHDFLNREPDAGGLSFWVDQIESCGSDVGCREVRRINVSAAFFLSIEFQETGYFAYRVYNAAYGTTTSPNVPGTVPIIRLQEFLPDSQQIGFGVQVGIGNWQQKLEDNKNAYVLEFVQTPRFITAFPLSMTADQFVSKLDQNAGGVLSTDEKAQLVALLATAPADSAKRASVLRSVAEDSDLRQRELNRAFVLMQFYGYLRRNPDDPQDTDFRGWKFWLDKLNQFNGNFVAAEMVKSFLVSGEYRQRFGTP